jgi:Spy/CpxP family protein refolding chaperone
MSMPKTKALTLAVIILMVINIALVGLIWFRPLLMPHPKPHQERMQRFMFEQLHLDAEQQKEISRLRKEHIALRRNQERQLAKAREELLDAAFSSSIDSTRINQLLTRIGTAQMALDNGLIEHIWEMQKHMDASQKQELQKLFGQMMHMRRPQDEGSDHRKRMPTQDKRGMRGRKEPPSRQPQDF